MLANTKLAVKHRNRILELKSQIPVNISGLNFYGKLFGAFKISFHAVVELKKEWEQWYQVIFIRKFLILYHHTGILLTKGQFV